MATEHGPGRAYISLYHGSVTRNDDPLRIGRVKVRVPGLLEPESRWAFPLGTGGGGSKSRGQYAPPKVGAEVGVLCCQGDPDFVFFLSGHWGAPRGTPDSPSFLHGGDITDASAPDVVGFEYGQFTFIFDTRTGKASFEIRDNVTGDGIAYDSTLRAMEIKATTAIKIDAIGAVDIKGAVVTINGRPVAPSSEPI